jgi:hypothetical protein
VAIVVTVLEYGLCINREKPISQRLIALRESAEEE